MSDLISRKKIRDYIKGEINTYGKPFEGTAYELGLKIMRYIDAMDSDYDVDKVVEELEEVKIINVDVGYGTIYKTIRKDTVIEIVKQGGVSNDSYSLQSQIDGIKDFAEVDEIWQQLHIDESENFTLDGENEPNCDLALLTRHFKKDNSNMQFDRPLPTKGEKYKHFKLGKIVTVIGLSRHTETEEITVVYEYEGTIWNRPLEMFMSEVDKEKYPNVSQKYRFEKVVE